MNQDSSIEVERLGGFAGFGGPGARIRSCGVLEWSQLSSDECQALAQQFTEITSVEAAGRLAADGFQYRITATVNGTIRTIVLPEQSVPVALRDCVRDELL
ncbi:MAG: hypothetical protein J7556_20105 [Acidovorax sp.]|nr:hypothetical protein [Acidovorax sp.]